MILYTLTVFEELIAFGRAASISFALNVDLAVSAEFHFHEEMLSAVSPSFGILPLIVSLLPLTV